MIFSSPAANFNGIVALLAEGVDRNFELCPKGQGGRVALLAEGVDRNSSAAASLPP